MSITKKYERRYLYRAKRTDNGEWVEGLLTIMWRQYHIINPSNENIAYAIDETTICQYTGLTDVTKWENLTKKEQQLFLLKWNYKENRHNQKEDWTGKEIWENDIVEREMFGKKVRGIITWHDIGFTGFMLKVCNGGSVSFYSLGRGMFDDDEGCQCSDEVIGNVFDNPKLIDMYSI